MTDDEEEPTPQPLNVDTMETDSKSWNRARPTNTSVQAFPDDATHYAVGCRDTNTVHSVIYQRTGYVGESHTDDEKTESTPDALVWCDCQGFEYNDECAHVLAVHRQLHDDMADTQEELNHFSGGSQHGR
jgi:hypothetical protein